jgi:hypothetical protein
VPPPAAGWRAAAPAAGACCNVQEKAPYPVLCSFVCFGQTPAAGARTHVLPMATSSSVPPTPGQTTHTLTPRTAHQKPAEAATTSHRLGGAGAQQAGWVAARSACPRLTSAA